MIPCFGGFPPSFLYLKSAFSAPSICMVEAGSVARCCRPPALAMSRAPISGPTSAVMLGARVFISLVICSSSRLSSTFIVLMEFVNG